MCDNTPAAAWDQETLINSSSIFKFVFILFIAYFVIRFLISCYKAANCPGIHYVNFKQRPLQVVSNYNPFSCEVDYNSASYSGIKCKLKSEHSCYVQAFWGVPMKSLIELLNGEWLSLIDSITTHIPTEKFSSKCICSDSSFLLHAEEEKSIEFKPDSCNIKDVFSQGATCMREHYPFVVLMVLTASENVTESFVVAMASAIHIPDDNLSLHPHLIAQYTKLFSGHVGQVKKVFLSSPETSNDETDKCDLCLICYLRPVSMVPLPCRHACLCSVCFELCDRCPVCRAYSPSCFKLPDNDI